MSRALALLLLLLLLLAPGGVRAQGTNVNPTPGSLWTYLGATYGAGWALPVPSIGGVLTPASLTPFNPLGTEAMFTGVMSGAALNVSGITTLPGGAIEFNSLVTDLTGQVKKGTIITGGTPLTGPFQINPSQNVASETMSSLPMNWRTASLITYDDPNVPTTQTSAVAIAATYTGGQANGPSLSQSPLIISSVKRDYWVNANNGEVDGLWAYCRQGRKGDSSCGLFDSASINDPTIINYGRTSSEMHGTLYNTNMTVNMETGLDTNYMITGNPPYAMVAMFEAEQGTVHDGILITTSDFSGGANPPSLVNAIGISQSRSTTNYYWKVTGTGDQLTNSLQIGLTGNVLNMTANPPVISAPGSGVSVLLQAGPGTGLVVLESGSGVYMGSIANGSNWAHFAAAGGQVNGGLEVGSVAGGIPGTGIVNSSGYQTAGVGGVNCSGATTASFAASGGIVTHC